MLQPIPEGVHATRTTTPRDYSIEGSTPRAKHVVTPSSHPLRIEGCEDRESAAWPEPRDVTETKHVLGSLSLTTCQRPAQPVVGRPVVRMCELSDHRGVMVALDVGVLSPCLEYAANTVTISYIRPARGMYSVVLSSRAQSW